METTITIGGREFRVGATYQSAHPMSHIRRKLIGDFRRRDDLGRKIPMVQFESGNGNWGATSEAAWLRWAGDEVAP
jgi:hypothetical protein